MKKLYFLHIPKCGGTTMYYILSQYLKFYHPNINGNAMLDNKTRLEIWNFNEKEIINFSQNIDVIFNEDELGEYIYPNLFDYIIILRHPIDRLLSHTINHFIIDLKNESIINNYYHHLKENAEHYRNYTLKFFYKHNYEDQHNLLIMAKNRIKYFTVIDFDNLDDGIKKITEKINIKLDTVPKHHIRHEWNNINRHNIPYDIKNFLENILKNDIEFYNYAIEKYAINKLN
jgi:hypothetical protein